MEKMEAVPDDFGIQRRERSTMKQITQEELIERTKNRIRIRWANRRFRAITRF